MSSADHGYERSDARPRPLLAFASALAVVIAASFAVTRWITAGLGRARDAAAQPSPMDAFRETPEGPLLQPGSGQGLAEHRAREDELLSRYGWVDRENGVVRVPIERAMELLLERGLPTRTGEGAAEPVEAEGAPGEGGDGR